MNGLMQDMPLLISSIIEHAARAHGATEIVTRTNEGPILRTSYGEVAARARQVANALAALGIAEGDRVATLAWNTHRHYELYFGVSGSGAVLHTVNPRLFRDQVAFIMNHADDRVVFVDLNLVSVAESVAADLPGVTHWVILTDDAHMPETSLPGALCYETLIAAQPTDYDWPQLDENAAAVLCYTSGTTGNPKGVLYSHRSTVLHGLISCSVDSTIAASAAETILVLVPLFHANAWGVPYAAAMAGSKLVFPASKLDPASIVELINGEGVTVSGGVPTVWVTYLQHLDQHPEDRPTRLKRVFVGGSALPRALMERFDRELGVTMIHAWGMTETSPIVTVALPLAKHERLDEEALRSLRLTQGRPVYGTEVRIVDEAGTPVAHDGRTPGNVQVRGPWIVKGYFGRDELAVDDRNWFPTGDVGTIDADGYLRLTDRTKDVIKSGGEWISSIEIENEAVSHPGVLEAAVIGVPHPRWQERPLLIVTPRAGAELTREQVLAHLEPRIARWWMPDDVVVLDELPHTATGKIWKIKLREAFKDYRLPTA
ncbi:long-chain-fatty-acid--CoA ligase [Tistrella mobilis]|uniref:long-chain-fatty-acid--CoA ligase n=1 Tax=Tistrella mobilis TaxID=171437 RepID=UPI00355797B5